MISAIIPAAGRGRRMGTRINKQFMALKGIPILARTLITLEESPFIDELILVCAQDELEYCWEEIIIPYELKKIKKIVSGGAERQDSVANGLEAIGEAEIVLIHDGARPFLTQELISRVIEGAKLYGAAGVAVPVKDTIKVVDEKGFICSTPNRRLLWSMQTPQAFKTQIIREAYACSYRDSFYGTDDCMLVERLGYRVKIIEGAYENIKVTTPDDLAVGERILESQKHPL
jgi:2-C-methyl-D-erythritol 4-phosphate cytidylyltransferase